MKLRKIGFSFNRNDKILFNITQPFYDLGCNSFVRKGLLIHFYNIANFFGQTLRMSLRGLYRDLRKRYSGVVIFFTSNSILFTIYPYKIAMRAMKAFKGQPSLQSNRRPKSRKFRVWQIYRIIMKLNK